MTLAEKIALRQEYRTAISKVLKQQSYTIAETTYTYANLRYLQEEFTKLDNEITASTSTTQRTAGRMVPRRIIPRDD